MTSAEWLLDVVIGVLLLVLAGGSLHARSLQACLSLFLAFGIVLTLAWARLGAPDLALAEAAIGAGLTGALLFNALQGAPPESLPLRNRLTWPVAAVFAGLVFLLVLQGAWPAADLLPVLPEQVAQELPRSGVTHPVTAVLLNFRSWDTLLELAVLLVALLGVRTSVVTSTPSPKPWTVLLAWSKSLVPLLVVVSGYLLWRGASGPGGAFQAGALLAAGAVLLRMNNVLPPLRWSYWPLRASVLAGLVCFLLVAGATAVFGAAWLSFPLGHNKLLITLIEILATLSIAVTLTLLVVGEKEELRP